MRNGLLNYPWEPSKTQKCECCMKDCARPEGPIVLGAQQRANSPMQETQWSIVPHPKNGATKGQTHLETPSSAQTPLQRLGSACTRALGTSIYLLGDQASNRSILTHEQEAACSLCFLIWDNSFHFLVID